jgi:hypothetical protein
MAKSASQDDFGMDARLCVREDSPAHFCLVKTLRKDCVEPSPHVGLKQTVRSAVSFGHLFAKTTYSLHTNLQSLRLTYSDTTILYNGSGYK